MNPTHDETRHDFDCPRTAFDDAITEGRLSADIRHENYVGNFMFMGRDKIGRAMFKNISTRRYLA